MMISSLKNEESLKEFNFLKVGVPQYSKADSFQKKIKPCAVKAYAERSSTVLPYVTLEQFILISSI